MKEELKDEEVFQEELCLFDTDHWAPDVNVSSESMRDLCKPNESFCRSPESRTKTNLSTIVCSTLLKIPSIISTPAVESRFSGISLPGPRRRIDRPTSTKSPSAFGFCAQLHKNAEDSKSHPISRS